MNQIMYSVSLSYISNMLLYYGEKDTWYFILLIKKHIQISVLRMTYENANLIFSSQMGRKFIIFLAGGMDT